MSEDKKTIKRLRDGLLDAKTDLVAALMVQEEMRGVTDPDLRYDLAQQNESVRKIDKVLRRI